MAGNTATLVFDIDGGPARTAASDLAKLNDAAVRAAGGADKLNKSLRDSQGRFRSSYDVAKQYGSEIRGLAAKYNPALNAVYQYQQAQTELNRAVALGVLTQGQADAALERTALQMQQVAAGTRQVGNAQGTVGNQFAQLNDVVVTAWGGMNPALIGMQQGMQVVQGMAGKTVPEAIDTLKGAFAQLLSPMTLLTVGGIALAATAIQFGASFLTASGQAESLEDVLGRIATSTDNLNKASSAAIAPLDELRKKYGENAEAVREWLRLDLMRQQAMALETAAPQIAELVSLARAYDGLGLTVEGRLNETRNLAKMFNWNAEEAGKFQVILRKLTEAKTLQEQAEAAEEVRNFIAQAGAATDALNSKFGTALQGIAPLVAAAWELAAALRTASASSAPTGTLFDDRQQSIQENRAGVQDARAAALARVQAGWLDPDNAGGGGGGGALAQAEKQFQSLRELLQEDTMFQYAEYEKRSEQLKNAKARDLLTEKEYQTMKQQLQMLYFGMEFERNAVNYQLSLEQLKMARANELLTEEQFLMQRQQLQHDYYSQAVNTDQNQSAQTLSNMAANFGQMNQLAGGGYDALLKAQRTFAAASALINAYEAASQALRDPTLPWWAKASAAASVLAAGMGMVNAIKGGGKSGGGVSTSTTAATQATKAQPTQYVTIDVTGDSWARGVVEGVIEQIQQQTKDGRVVFRGNR